MAEKNIFAHKLFLSLNIADFNLFFIFYFFFFSVDDSVRARRVYGQKIIILDYHIKIIP